MKLLKNIETLENCPKGCESMSYLHDNLEDKTCCSCRTKWNRITKEIKNMKTIIITLLLSISTYSQVGIATTIPTETLDVNGSARVRNLTDGTIQTNSTGVLSIMPYKASAMAVVSLNGSILRGFGVASVTRLNNTTYRVNFVNALPNNDYVINFSAKQRQLSYDNVTVNGFDVIVSQNPNQITDFDFNFSVFSIY